MHYYIKNRMIFSFQDELQEKDGFPTGTDISEQGEKYVKLTKKQYELAQNHPGASLEEIWECRLNEVTPYIPTNEEIALLREARYKSESDSLFISWQKYLTTGLIEKADEARTKWLEKVTEIDRELPYND